MWGMNNAKKPLSQSIFNVVIIMVQKSCISDLSPLPPQRGKGKVTKRNMHIFGTAAMPTTENSCKTYFSWIVRHWEGEIQYVLIFIDSKFLLSLGLICLFYLNSLLRIYMFEFPLIKQCTWHKKFMLHYKSQRNPQQHWL